MKYKLLILCFLIFNSCSTILYKIYGIKELSYFDKKQYNDFILSIDTTQISFFTIISDANQFEKLVDITIDSAQRKLFYQPIQIIYFQNEKITSYHINCHAGVKSRKLDWNIHNRFHCFPPNTAVDIHNITLSLTQCQEIYNDINHGVPYTIIIFWTLMMEDISKNAIDMVTKNVCDFKMQDSTNIYLINIDKFFIQ